MDSMDPFGRKRRKELEGLVGHLKKDKKTLRNNYFKSLRGAIEQIATERIDSMASSKELTKHPYMYVSSKGIILGYTKALEVALGITENVKGMHYLDVLHFPNESEGTRQSLIKHFSSPHKMQVPYDRIDGKKTRKLTITKEEPAYTREIEVDSLRGTKTFRAVKYVQISVTSRKRKKRIPKISKEDAAQRAAHIDDATFNLIVNHNWDSERIDTYTTDHGELGLIKKYDQLEKRAK